VINKYLVIIGPSGVGKSTMVQELSKQGVLVVWPTYTTRPARPDEKAAIEHVFINKQQFADKKADGFFVSTVELFGLPYEYGLPRKQPKANGKVTCVMLRAPVIEQFAKHFNNFVIYQIEADMNSVSERLQKREQEMGNRLKNYQQELKLGRKLAARVFINDSDVNALTRQVKLAIVADFS